MAETKDYSKQTLEELQAQEKKLKQSQTLSNVLIGFLAGVLVFGVVTKGLKLLVIGLPVFLILVIYRNAKAKRQALQLIQEELQKRMNQ